MPALRRTAFAALAAALALTYGPSAGAQTIVVGPWGIGVATVASGLVTVPVVADMTASGGASLGPITGRLTWHPAVVRHVSVSGNTVTANSGVTLVANQSEQVVDSPVFQQNRGYGTPPGERRP